MGKEEVILVFRNTCNDLLAPLKGAVVGAVSGAVVGGGTAAVKHRYTTGGWSGAGKAALDGAASGYMGGAISGAITGGPAAIYPAIPAPAPPVATVTIAAVAITAVPITTLPTVEEAKSFTAPAAFLTQFGNLKCPLGSIPQIGLFSQ